MNSSSKTSGRLWPTVVLLLFVAYAAVFIWRSSVQVNSERAFVLFDDAMISMRYAANLAHGFGLVWNPGGDRVEGITNPGWTVLLAPFHLLPIPPLRIALVVQVFCASILFLNLLVVRRLTIAVLNDAPAAQCVATAAVVMTAFYYPLNYWGLLGMEVGLCALITTIIAERLVSRRDSTGTMSFAAAATLIRLDMAVLFLAAWSIVILHGERQSRRHGVIPLLLFVGAVGGQTLFRFLYYGDILPNTYYLKMTGFPVGLRILRGLVHMTWFLLTSLWPLLIVGVILLTSSRCRQKNLPDRGVAGNLLPILVIFAAQAAYSVYVGGDAWERLIACNRFVSIAMPALFAAAATVLYTTTSCLRFGNVAFPATVCVLIVNLNAFPRTDSILQWLLIRPPTFTATNRENLEFALRMKQATRPDAIVAVDAAGVIPYFLERRCIDLLGKCDPVIAREPMHRSIMTRNPLLEFYPGHLKWNYSYSIGTLKPDVVAARWGRSKDNAYEYLTPDYELRDGPGPETWFRKTSTHRPAPNATKQDSQYQHTMN